MQTVTVDLRGIRGTQALLVAFGYALHFGGASASDNIKARKDRGWGINWAALNDCLSCLDSGGIWGTSPKYKFPLHLSIKHNGTLSSSTQTTMLEVLEDTKKLYAKENKQFTYELELDQTSTRGRPFRYLLSRLKTFRSPSTRKTVS